MKKENEILERRRLSRTTATTIAVCACGAVFLFIGISRGEAGVVLAKAVRICLECIGIG
ncbi:MAG: thioredoxin [Clostridiales Family XIII bacterium]|jgi:hypothetical protein|nr:thioredoxin [Clostridiales Family XIII bacterium]